MRYEHYTVAQGDTLQVIAQNKLGNMSLWHKIVELNNLEYPYISDESKYQGNHKIVGVGQTIILPKETPTLTEEDLPNVSQQVRDSITDYALGIDLNLMQESDNFQARGGMDELVSLNIKGRGTSLEKTAGNYNLAQAIMKRLNTIQGTLPLHPKYGSKVSRYLGTKNTVSNVAKLKVEVERTVRADARVKSVTITTSQVTATNVVFELVITPISLGEQLTMVLDMADSLQFQVRG